MGGSKLVTELGEKKIRALVSEQQAVLKKILDLIEKTSNLATVDAHNAERWVTKQRYLYTAFDAIDKQIQAYEKKAWSKNIVTENTTICTRIAQEIQDKIDLLQQRIRDELGSLTEAHVDTSKVFRKVRGYRIFSESEGGIVQHHA